MLKRALVIATAAGLTIAGIAVAQTSEGIKRQAQAEIARWELQKAAAYRDVQLTKDVAIAFYAATNPANGLPSSVAVNSALRPLRDRFSDYRLNYRSDADYCPIVRAIGEAQRAAANRARQAIDKQGQLLLVEQLHNSIVSLRMVGDNSGRAPRPIDVDRPFLREVQALGGESISTTWGEQDYLRANFSTRDCN